MNAAAKLVTQSVELAPTVDAVVAAVARCNNPAVLDSADTGPGRGRFTIVACEPVEVARWDSPAKDPFLGMRERLRILPKPRKIPASLPPAGFVGGWIGYFAYEAGRFIERLPATTHTDVGLPIARFALYDAVAIHDAATDVWTLVGIDLASAGYEPARDRSLEQAFEVLHGLLAEAGAQAEPPPAPPAAPDPRTNLTRAEFEAIVQQARDYIAAGDIFQVNLARRLTFEAREPLINTYLRLRQANPGGYAAFLAWPGTASSHGRSGEGVDTRCAILSASPELFLQMRDREVITRPIKGTRPRSSDAVIDRALQADLAASEKDRAELAMIVDLERNDLGRVCEFGSVRVDEPAAPTGSPYDLETHPTVHHLVATVRGRLRPDRDAVDLLRACFPGGSITGAPKVRAMEIIDELEPTERSVYTGAIGCFSFDGSMTFNIAIRTILAAQGRLHVYAGGGIVADSVPADEYDETTAKALGLCRALGAEPARLDADEAVQASRAYLEPTPARETP